MNRRMLARSVALAMVAGAILAVGTRAATAETPEEAMARLGATIDAILADGGLAGAQASVVVADPATGQVLYNRNGDRRLMPGSNAKLLTSTAALDILGPDYRFATTVLSDGARRGPAVHGNLYLRGTGDPTMLAADYDALAAEIAASGVRLVTGGLVADDTWFDDRRLGLEWAWDDEPFYYAAQVSALTVAPDTDYDAGNVIVTATPAATAGAKPVVSVSPATGWVRFDNRATTVASGGTGLSITRQHGTNTFVITGSAGAGGGGVSEWMSVDEPTGYAADVFRRALAAHGVRVLGPTTLGRPTPAGATTLATHQSMTLRELLVPFLKLSNNSHAEVLTKAMGRQVSGAGTWAAGLAAVADYAAGLGVNMGTIAQADGAGLSRRNLVPPAEIVDLLIAVRAEPWFPTWYEALPIAGNPARFVGGTLRNRLRDTPAANNLHGKTGSFTGANALSGYITDADGTPLVFSGIINNQLGAVNALHDRIAIALATFSRTASAARSAVVPAPPSVPAVPRDLECAWVKPNLC